MPAVESSVADADGYVLTPYTCHHHPGLDPLRAEWVARRQGFAPRAIGTACELGFGQGLSLAIHATAGDVEWWGTELNPQHVALTHALLPDAAARQRIRAASFRDFFADTNLPQFDFIALHGVWSWISSGNRLAISEFIERKLAPGGLLYVSYNAMPGWSSALSLRELLVAHANRSSQRHLTLDVRIEQALEYAVSVAAANPLWLQTLPQAERQLRDIRHRSPAYLAHEYFNRDWRAWHYAELAQVLEPLGLHYVGQADCSDGYDVWRFSATQLQLLAACDDVSLRETTRDLLLDRRFRRDIWCRGAPQKKSPSPSPSVDPSLSRQRLLLQERYSLNGSPDLPAVSQLRDRFSAAGGIATVSELIGSLDDERAFAWLWRAGEIGLECARSADATRHAAVRALNESLLELAWSRSDISALASTVTGTGVELDWVELALLRACLARRSFTECVVEVEARARALAAPLVAADGVQVEAHSRLEWLGKRLQHVRERHERYQDGFALPLGGLPVFESA
jgi:hypothetical protein